MSDGFVRVHRHTIIAATARHKIPTVYPLRLNAADGGLLAYGPYYVDLFRQVATYISIAFSVARTLASCRSRYRPSSSSSLISRPRRPLASQCRHRFRPAPTN
jgi:hypothetical protein